MVTVKSLVVWIASKIRDVRVIYDGEGRSPYLTRHYLIGAPKMPDGSRPFDEFGDMRPSAIWSGRFGIYLHRFHRSDSDRELHNHPWRWSCSLVLAGGYVEERRSGDAVISRRVTPGRFNWIGHDDFHRVDLIEKDAWTLFVVGPKVSSWGFWSRISRAFVPWREFIAGKRAP